jgi:hypothetical protein
VQREDKTLVEAKLLDGLCTFKARYQDERAAVAVSKETPELWHKRFGHLGYNNLARLPGMVKGIGMKAKDFKAAAQSVCEQ